MSGYKDAMTETPIGIDYVHHKIHEGDNYLMCHQNSALADNGTISFHITVGATKQLHAISHASCGGDALVQVFETPLSATSGTSVTPKNKNRASSKTSGVTVLRDATIGTAGTIIKEFMMGAGTGGNAGAERDELILPVSGVYEYRLTNLGGGAKVASLCVDFYEQEDLTVS